MTLQFYTWFTLTAIIVTVMAVDKNVAEFFILTGKIIDVNIRRYILMIKLHPRNPLTNYFMHRRMSKLAEELTKKIKEKELKVND